MIVLKTIDELNVQIDEIREKGKKILEKIPIEEYNKKKKKTFKPKVPSISEVKAFRKEINK